MADAPKKTDGRGESMGCPFMDCGDSRCSRHFSLGRLDEAFTICLNGFSTCETYYQLRDEHGIHDEPIKIGKADRDGHRLRRTGS